MSSVCVPVSLAGKIQEASAKMSKIPSAAATLTFSSAEEHKNYNAMELDSSTPSSTTLAPPHNRQRCWGMNKNEVRCHKVGDSMIEIQGKQSSTFLFFCSDSDSHSDLEHATSNILDDPQKVFCRDVESDADILRFRMG